MLSIKTLPVLEQWECARCGRCCRGSLIWLDESDREKLQAQGWDRHSDFATMQTVVREGWIGSRYRLAQRPDGSCVFLMPDGRCRVHTEFGADAKPLICRMFPLQLVPLEKTAILTTRRACPTAAADQGLSLHEYQAESRQLAAEAGLIDEAVSAPPITKSWQAGWNEFTIVGRSLEKLMCDARFPLVRRLTHALKFCDLLESRRVRKVDSGTLPELCELFESGAEDVGDLFQNKAAVESAAAVLFRQTAAEYLRLHHRNVARETWSERWRMAWSALRIVRGKGKVPLVHGDLPETTFQALERPLGHLGEAVQRPFLRFFETQLASKQFAVVCRPGWPLVESFRALALAYPVGLWLLRLLSTGRAPLAEDAIDVVTMLDRGQGFARLTNAHHRARVATLARLGGLERLTVWYAR